VNTDFNLSQKLDAVHNHTAARTNESPEGERSLAVFGGNPWGFGRGGLLDLASDSWSHGAAYSS
jgi:hypothetical protein